MEELERRGETDFEEIRNMKNIIEHCLEGDLGKVQSQLENNLVDNFKVWWDVPGTNADESLDPKQKDLMNAVATGKFDLRKTWIGQKWGRQMKTSKFIPRLGNYDECKRPRGTLQLPQRLGPHAAQHDHGRQEGDAQLAAYG